MSSQWRLLQNPDKAGWNFIYTAMPDLTDQQD